MLGRIVAVLALLAVAAGGSAGCRKEPAKRSEALQTAPAAGAGSGQAAEQLFKQYCAACHPDGGNVVTPRKTLHAAVLADNGISKPEQIVALMRKPGPGMRTLDAATISDQDARSIAAYVLAAFR